MIKRCTRKTESWVIWLLAFLPRAKARGFPALDSDEDNHITGEPSTTKTMLLLGLDGSLQLFVHNDGKSLKQHHNDLKQPL